MSHFASRVLPALLTMVTSTSCKDTSGPVQDPCNGNIESVTMIVRPGPIVRSGDNLEFDWEPRCGMARLVVAGATGGSYAWVITASENADNSIFPPVRYGVAPRDATVKVLPQALLAGSTYVFTIARELSDDSTLRCMTRVGNVCTIGAYYFARQ